jgi:hypothetical protein
MDQLRLEWFKKRNHDGLTDLHCRVVGAPCGKAYLAMIFQNIKSEMSCLVHQAHPKLQSQWKIANCEIHNEIECNLVLPTQVPQAHTCVTVSNLHSL